LLKVAGILSSARSESIHVEHDGTLDLFTRDVSGVTDVFNHHTQHLATITSIANIVDLHALRRYTS
jgi:gamma-glutamylcysteine synthetase